MNHGICRICGTLLKPYDNVCSACGFEDGFDSDSRFPMDGEFADGDRDTFLEDELDQDSDEEDPPERD